MIRGAKLSLPQQFGVVFFHLTNQLIYSVVVQILIELIIQNTHHVFDVHTIQDGVDIVCLQFVAVDDVVSHDDCV